MDILCYLCLVFVMFSCLLIAALWSPAEKGLTSGLLLVMFNCVFVTFPCGILGQVWYLLVLIPDLCRISYCEKIKLTYLMAGGIDNISSPGDVDISSLFVSAVCNCVHFNSSFTSFNESLSVTILWN